MYFLRSCTLHFRSLQNTYPDTEQSGIIKINYIFTTPISKFIFPYTDTAVKGELGQSPVKVDIACFPCCNRTD